MARSPIPEGRRELTEPASSPHAAVDRDAAFVERRSAPTGATSGTKAREAELFIPLVAEIRTLRGVGIWSQGQGSRIGATLPSQKDSDRAAGNPYNMAGSTGLGGGLSCP